MRFLLLTTLVLPITFSHADAVVNPIPSPAATVRGYFEALGKNDFPRALSFTTGEAQSRTEHMMGTLKQQAAAAHARVELKVKHVQVWQSPDPQLEGLPIPVDVQFDIDVVGKKWIFSRVARKLSGRAQFYVACASPAPRIIAIEGKIE